MFINIAPAIGPLSYISKLALPPTSLMDRFVRTIWPQRIVDQELTPLPDENYGRVHGAESFLFRNSYNA
jgi:hypothetical protein